MQGELADTLQRLVREGAAGFYAGEFASSMATAVRKAGGIWQSADLAQYSVVTRKPIRGEYMGWRLTSAAPPSSGGVALVTMLNILSAYDLEQMDEVGRAHHIVEAMRHAYRDRAEFLGDADFVDVPIDRLISAKNAASKREWIKPDKATSSASLPAVPVDAGKGRDTTHFSILDKHGNRVAATLSINYPFGSGFVIPGTGVLLNDEMDDFSRQARRA